VVFAGWKVGVQSDAEAMLLDRYLPEVAETHAEVVDADTLPTWQAVLAVVAPTRRG
jgi:hypothetical protein